MRKVQKDGWTRAVSNWTRIVQRAAGRDEDGRKLLEIEEAPVTMIREDYGHTSCFAENEHIMRGLKRVHIYAA